LVYKSDRYDLWLGDCLEVMGNISNKSVDLILCDLPYGTTACKWDTVIPFEALWNCYNRVIKDNGAIVLFGSEPFSSALRMSNIKKYKYDWVWNKKLAGNAILAKKQPLKIHENVIVFNTNIYNPVMTKGKPRKKMSERLNTNDAETLHNSKTKCNEYENDTYYPVSIQEFTVANMRGNRLHPTQKPVDLLEYLIKTYTVDGDLVLDNCMGSGSTGVAALNTNRRFVGIELDATYCDIAFKRIQDVDANYA
jgi:site-specific DNA-methyltransferase (adenine-specific)